MHILQSFYLYKVCEGNRQDLSLQGTSCIYMPKHLHFQGSPQTLHSHLFYKPPSSMWGKSTVCTSVYSTEHYNSRVPTYRGIRSLCSGRIVGCSGHSQ